MPAPRDPPALLAWVQDMTAWCGAAAVHWCDGSIAERDALLARMVASGTLIPLDPVLRPSSFLARSHASDVARVEDRTFICSARAEDAGPTNHWHDPRAMIARLRALFRGAMAGRTLYVVPFSMGPLGSPFERIGVQLTDSPYVVVSTRIMAHMGAAVLERLARRPAQDFVPCLHSVGAPLVPGQEDVPWPCAPDPADKYIVHFPDGAPGEAPAGPAIWSFGSGYGGNALLGKKCLALRIASTMARREGWMAEHMLIMSLTSPAGRTWRIAAAFPSACGKTNLAMLQPSLPGWTVRVVGDDIAWLRIGEHGRLRAVNPEAGFFGVAPGTSPRSNPHAVATISHDTIFTNVALTPAGDVWWEGLTDTPPPQLIDWEGRPWTPGCGRKAAHGNARFTAAGGQCPVIDPAWQDPAGVPIDAILFGGRRPGTVPLVNEAFSWEHGVFLGSTTGSETTAANLGQAGIMRRDPFAMLPFCGYHLGDYIGHWLDMGRRLGADAAGWGRAPRIFFVNWFRRRADGSYLWPGFGDNVRVLKWIVGRLDGSAGAQRTPIGWLPRAGDLDLVGLDLPAGAIDELLAVDVAGWRQEAESIATSYGQLGDRLPAAMERQLEELRIRLNGY